MRRITNAIVVCLVLVLDESALLAQPKDEEGLACSLNGDAPKLEAMRPRVRLVISAQDRLRLSLILRPESTARAAPEHRPGPRSASGCAFTGMLAADADGRGCSLGESEGNGAASL
jgi:hypothetical protein